MHCYVDRADSAAVESLADQIELDIQRCLLLIQPNTLDTNHTNIVITQADSQILFAHVECEAEYLVVLAGDGLPRLDPVVVGFAGGAVVFFRADPEGTLAPVGGDEEAFAVLLH